MFQIEFLILLILIFFQSIFGIGLLIFGTPTFLILGYNFQQSLSILLPISIIISFLQFFLKPSELDSFTKNVFKYCLAPMILALLIALAFVSIKYLKIMLAVLMIFISLFKIITKYSNLDDSYNLHKKHNHLILFSIGFIHGLTNLGGGFLSIYCSTIFKNDFVKVRKAIALGYLVFALFQLMIIYFSDKYFYSSFVYLIFIVPIIFLLSEYFLKKIILNSFDTIINLIVLSYGFALLIMIFFFEY